MATEPPARSQLQPSVTAVNPVLPGFHPDPSVCRVGDDYYLVTSTFEFWPGLPLFHSRDLVHWRPVGHAVDRPGQLALDGVRPSGGLYAASLTHHDGRFHLVCTLVDGHQRSGNFLLTTEDPAGDWSDPLWLPDAPGFDPSLFFDEDGSAHLLGTRQTDEEGHTAIWLRSLDLATGALGEEHVLFRGALVDATWAEGPHLYRHGGYYHLLLAEGGTEDGHAVTSARSTSLTGPYRNNPRNPVLTHRHLGSGQPVTGVGHADLVATPAGDWYALLLASRPYGGGPHANLGRETFLARVEWQDGWPVANPGVGRLEERTTVALPPHPWPARPARDDFDAPALGPEWNLLRTPRTELLTLTERPGHLRLRPQPATLADTASPAFVGRRQQHADAAARTLLDFTPSGEGEAAGLVAFYDHRHHAALLVVHDEQHGRALRLTVCDAGVETVRAELPLVPGPVELALTTRGQEYTFAFTPAGAAEPVRLPAVDGRLLSSAHAGGFTGTHLGVYATAPEPGGVCDVDWFEYGPAEEA
ncbi:glycoside hydrolase family 43 protein [Actinacidiphila yeochonensis]|uniref:glycoside hydrolase family 43 protein n=1 Tax=Actinacidiphila yeochonensis TaxID=89050 RepID=UPI0006893152|nr:glycoside hydrolase family 43 protein [Actinacidiphila yeochonensis]